MTRYRKRPVEVDAVKYDGTMTDELRELLGNSNSTWIYDHYLTVRTVDNNIVVVPIGAYVVLDSKGYAYPCDAEIFEANHERVT